MMVNFAVPRYNNLTSELHRNYLFKFKLVLSSVRSNTHMMASLWERITDLSRFNFSSEYGEIVQLQSALNDDNHIVSGKIKRLPYFRANNKKIFFPKLVPLRSVSCSFIDSLSLFPSYLFYLFSRFSLSFLIVLKWLSF